MRLRPRNVRSRLTLWYVLVLAGLLALYAGVASLFLFLSLREDFDQNLLQDVETVEGMLTKEPNGGVSLHSSRPGAAEPRIGHFIEVWSPQGSLLYRSAELQDQTLGGPPGLDEGLRDPSPSTMRLPNGTRVRLASSVYHVEDQRVVLRVAYSEEGLWRELGEFGEVLLLGFPIALLLAGVGGYALARKALAPIDSMATQGKKISAERLGDRLSIENPEDELGKLGTVFNAMLGRLQAAFDQLRRFTADASHELRTPLVSNGNFSVVLASVQGNYSFTRFLTFTSLVQLDTSNTQAMSANLRLRYNYRQDSDLFIIYNVGTQFASIAPANPPQVRETRFAVKWTYSFAP